MIRAPKHSHGGYLTFLCQKEFFLEHGMECLPLVSSISLELLSFSVQAGSLARLESGMRV